MNMRMGVTPVAPSRQEGQWEACHAVAEVDRLFQP